MTRHETVGLFKKIICAIRENKLLFYKSDLHDMHMHVLIVCNVLFWEHKYMRTTIDLPADLRQKLVAEAASRHMKGFSPLIVDALEQYFAGGDKERIKEISRLKGCLNKDEYEDEIKRIRKGRKNWRT
ncbi:MAG: hypothetical protein QGG87_00995 [Nitrospinota bacterium]|nr:hypothetical protein [Nitrospinota bacterium]